MHVLHVTPHMQYTYGTFDHVYTNSDPIPCHPVLYYTIFFSI